jgi:hypothetical protein
METLPPILLHHFKPGTILDGTLHFNEIGRSPQEDPYVF